MPSSRPRRRGEPAPAARTVAAIETLEPRRLLHAGHEHAFAVNINFQPPTTTVPAGYLADADAPYGDRGNGYTYGWTASSAGAARDRNSARSPDQRYDTVTHVRSRRWEIAVPDGEYAVRLVSGDANYFDSIYKTNVEGLLAVNGRPTDANRWLEGTSTVTVTDGRLTLSSASGASNNKWNFIQIESIDAATSMTTTTSPPPVVTITASDATAAEAARATGAFRITRTGSLLNELSVTISLSGTATRGADYDAIATSVVFPVGQSSVTRLVRPVDDAVIESSETVVSTLTSGITYTVGTAAAAKVTIADNDSAATPPSDSPLPTTRINFQPATASIPAGYIADVGSAYGLRSSGLTFGWSSANSTAARDRNSSRSPDQRYDTLVNSFGRTWALAVPNGTYRVRVVAGDPSYYDGIYRINVEGLLTVNGTPTSTSRWVEGTSTVAVSDGVLNLTNADTYNNKLCFIEVTPVTTTTTTSAPAAPTNLRASVASSSRVALSWTDASSNETWFEVERQLATTGGVWQQVASLSAGTTAYTDDRLAANTRYRYRVRAANAAGHSSYSAVVEAKTLAAGASAIAWQTGAAHPFERAESIGATVNGRLYLFGGFFVDAGGVIRASSRAHVYDPVADDWDALGTMPEPLTHTGTAVDGTTIWFVGGYLGDPPGPAVNRVWKYDTLTDTWSRGPDLPVNRGAGAAAIVGRTLHFVAGMDSTRTADRGEHWTLELDDAAATWVAQAPLPDARNHTAAASLGGFLYVIGGQKDDREDQRALASVWRYDPGSLAWAEMAALPGPRSHVASSTFVMDGRIYVVGGETGYDRPTRTVFAYDPLLDQWTSLTELPAARSTSVTGALGGGRFIAATGNSPMPTTSTWIGTVS